MKADDAILNPEALERAEDAGEGSTMSLRVSRDGAKMDVTYAPWSAPKQGQ